MRGLHARKAAIAATVSISFGLSGCIAAAVPLLIAQVGVLGFAGYKLVQTSSGGAVGVAFPGPDGKEAPPQPLPPARTAAVWPGNAAEVRFAEKLAMSGRFEVTPPAKVSVILADAKIGTTLTRLTSAEQAEAFGVVCNESRANLVFAGIDRGTETDARVFTLSRPSVTTKADLLAFSCSRKVIVWRDQLALIVEIGDRRTSNSEMLSAGGDAWADRILEAQRLGAVQASTGM